MRNKLFKDVYKSSFTNRFNDVKRKKRRSKLFGMVYNINLDESGKVSGITIEDDHNEINDIEVGVLDTALVDEFLNTDY